MVVDTRSEKVQNVRREVLGGMLENHYGDCLPPCRDACPADVDVQGYLALIAKDVLTSFLQTSMAWSLLRTYLIGVGGATRPPRRHSLYCLIRSSLPESPP
jgi:hypothetical protein